ncbi:MAG: Rho termination factor, N-terminal domain, partial [Bacteroidota bacterium]
MASLPDLSDRKLPELKELAESLGVPKARYLRKPELLEAIQQLGASPSPTSSEPASEAPAAEGRRRGRPSRANDEGSAPTAA